MSSRPEQAFDPNVATPPKSVEKVLAETIVRLKPGEPQLVGGKQMAGKEGNKSWVVITGHVGGAAAVWKMDVAK